MATGKPGSSRDLRLIVTPAGTGTWNMALDQALLQTVQIDQQPCLRIYQWAEPTLSLGYFQQLASRSQHPASLNCPVVRRATGGGAICHDQEITYSLVLPVNRVPGRDTYQLYSLVHQSVVDQLHEYQVAATLRDPTKSANHEADPFLCFLRSSTGDILIDQRKIGGSAQRRYRGVVLQHGSLLLKKCRYAPELPGIEDLTQITLDTAQWTKQWSLRLANELGLQLQPIELPENLAETASGIARNRFSCNSWTERR